MPAKRQVLDRRRHPQVTAAAVAAWRACAAIKDKRSPEFKAAAIALNQALGLTKFDISPVEVGPRPPDYFRHVERRWALEEWHRARRLADALLEAEAAAEAAAE
jgi:hypothetical protein